MAASQLKQLLDGTNASPSTSDAAEALRLLRTSNTNRPSLVLHLGDLALSNYRPTCIEYWHITADICRAASECGELEIAESMLDRIMHQFPKTSRTEMLNGISHEAKGEFNTAMNLYMQVIEREPMSPVIYKRQVAILKSKLKLPEAVAFINYYLSLYANDVEAWAELCALSLRLGRLSHALFAASELIINDPGNHAYHTLLADVYFTSGPTAHNLYKARAHYLASVNAWKKGNLRALYGIWLTCTMLIDANMVQHDEHPNQTAILLSHSKAAITTVYMSVQGRHQEQHHDHVHALLEQNIVVNTDVT